MIERGHRDPREKREWRKESEARTMVERLNNLSTK
jgi:hypothetical protein